MHSIEVLGNADWTEWMHGTRSDIGVGMKRGDGQYWEGQGHMVWNGGRGVMKRSWKGLGADIGWSVIKGQILAGVC